MNPVKNNAGINKYEFHYLQHYNICGTIMRLEMERLEIPKLVNLQTRDEYEEAFRYMWNWIADETIKRKEKVTKYEFFKEHGFGDSMYTLKGVPLFIMI